MRKKAFIGPLGDDIPSLFPIMAGILIFLISVFYIQSQIQERDAFVSIRKATLDLSYIATEKGFMPDSSFVQKCEAFRDFSSKNQLNFTVILKRFCGPVRLESQDNTAIDLRPGQIASEELLIVRERDLACAYDAFAQEAMKQGKRLDLQKKDAVIMTYPMAVECGEGLTGLGMISVVGWRG